MDIEQDSYLQGSENVVNKMWSRYVPYWPLFACMLVLGLVGGWIYLQTRLPLYETRAAVMIKDESRGSENSKVEESLNTLSSKKILENEIEVLRSRELMGQVVNELKLYAPVFKKGTWNDVSAYNLSPIKIEVQAPERLTEVKRVDFDFQPENATVTIDSVAYQLNQWKKTPYGFLRFSINNSGFTAIEDSLTGKYYFSLVHPRRIADGIIDNLSVSAVSKLSTVVNLKIEDAVPERGEAIINGLISAYNTASSNDKKNLSSNTITFLDDRLKAVSADLAIIEKKLQSYRATKGAIDLSSQGQLFLKNVSDNDQKLSDINMKLAVLDQVEQYISSDNAAGDLVPSTLGISDPVLTGLLEKLTTTELELESIKGTTAENNPLRVALDDQIKRIKPGIVRNVKSQRNNLEASKRNISSTNTAYNSQLQALPQQEQDLVEISREHLTKSNIYSFLLQKREETGLANSAASTSDSRVVDKAQTSLDPVGSGKFLILAVAILIALGLGVGIITAKESLNKTILFRQEIESITSYPVIGEIGQEKSKSAIVLNNGGTGYIAEQFRMLRTSLPYLGIGNAAKKVLITSTISGDGKSFVTVNLAMSLALAGKKVVIAEFDLNHPTLSYKLGMEKNSDGLADYLSGKMELNKLIPRQSINPNLYIISAGHLPPNPSELIMSDRVDSLLNQLEKDFDYVILDSAPVGLLSDGYVLSKKCDATLYVVRHNHTPKKMLQRLEQINQINELKNLGLVFNGVRQRGFANTGYGYGYSSEHSYRKNLSQILEKN